MTTQQARAEQARGEKQAANRQYTIWLRGLALLVGLAFAPLAAWALPDLAPIAVSVSTGYATSFNTLGGTTYLSDTTKNQGTVATTVTSRVGYYLSTDNVITTTDTFLGYRNLSSVAAGASSTVSNNYVAIPAGLAPGTYYIGAIADHTALEAEIDESNNTLVSATSTISVILPDLIMTAIGSSATHAAAGGLLNVSDTLKNQATVGATVAGLRVGYYLSTDNVITTTDTFLGSRNAGTPPAGSSSVNAGASFATVPVGMATGSYYLGAIADYSGLQAETDEANNAIAGPMIAIGPDWVMTAISSTHTVAYPGGTISIADTLKNQGASATSSGCRLIGYYLSADSSITTADTLIGSRQHCGTLAAAASNGNAAVNVTLPATKTIGTYYLGAIADYTGVELEGDETNNSLSGATLQLTLLPAAPTNVVATGTNVSATVTFHAPASDGGSPITGYTVTSSPAGGVDNNAGTTSLSHTISGLVNGTTYTFSVIATNAAGSSEASVASNSVTPATVADAPVMGTAVGASQQATVTFSGSVNNGGAEITGYTVTSSPAGGVDSNAGTLGLSHIVTGLVNGTAYTFTVVAKNAAGNSLASAASNSVTPAIAVPDAPSNVIAASGAIQAVVSFSAPFNGGGIITGYTVSANPAGPIDSQAGTTGLIHTLTGLVTGTTYTFTVTASNQAGTSAPSEPSNSVTASAKISKAYYIYSDQLNTPREITDSSGVAVWQWDNSDPFGNNAANENPGGAGQFSFNLRFPGQYFDKETNTHYNINRDYDPAIGRYIESDPIGLRGGINTYTYVGNNPLKWIDPKGLYVCYYSIVFHEMVCHAESEGNSNYQSDNWASGHGSCQNDPTCVGRKNEGPLTPGCYRVSDLVRAPKLGKPDRHRRDLFPFSPDPYNRDSFQTHSCGNSIGSGCSNGCAVTSDSEIDRFNDLIDNELGSVICVTY